MNKLYELPFVGSLLRALVFCLVLLLSYLLQVSAMPYLKVNGIAPNLLLVTLSVVAVGFGRLRSFWTGGFFGLLL